MTGTSTQEYVHSSMISGSGPVRSPNGGKRILSSALDGLLEEMTLRQDDVKGIEGNRLLM